MSEKKTAADVSEKKAATEAEAAAAAKPVLPEADWEKLPNGKWKTLRAFHFDKSGDGGCRSYAPEGCTMTEAEALDVQGRRWPVVVPPEPPAPAEKADKK